MSSLIVRRSLRMAGLLVATLLSVLGGSQVARADGFATGEFVSYGQADWVTIGTATQLLENNFSGVYSHVGAELVVGDTSNFELLFSSAVAVESYLPASGNPGPLDESLLNPFTTSSGVFGGDVVALALDVDFSAAGVLAHPAGTVFGNLFLTGYDGPLSDLNGMTVNQLLKIEELALSGDPSPIPIAVLQPAVDSLNGAFSNGIVTSAADHFTVNNQAQGNGSGNTPSVPEPSSLLLLALGLVPLRLLCFWRRNSFYEKYAEPF